MKTWEDVCNRLKAEIEQWFIKQCKNPFKNYYLVYHPTTPERDGGFFVSSALPDGYQYVTPQAIRKDCTKEQNYNIFVDLFRRLPILETGRES